MVSWLDGDPHSADHRCSLLLAWGGITIQMTPGPVSLTRTLRSLLGLSGLLTWIISLVSDEFVPFWLALLTIPWTWIVIGTASPKETPPTDQATDGDSEHNNNKNNNNGTANINEINGNNKISMKRQH